jgi:hypothetical protein
MKATVSITLRGGTATALFEAACVQASEWYGLAVMARNDTERARRLAQAREYAAAARDLASALPASLQRQAHLAMLDRYDNSTKTREIHPGDTVATPDGWSGTVTVTDDRNRTARVDNGTAAGTYSQSELTVTG